MSPPIEDLRRARITVIREIENQNQDQNSSTSNLARVDNNNNNNNNNNNGEVEVQQYRNHHHPQPQEDQDEFYMSMRQLQEEGEDAEGEEQEKHRQSHQQSGRPRFLRSNTVSTSSEPRGNRNSTNAIRSYFRNRSLSSTSSDFHSHLKNTGVTYGESEQGDGSNNNKKNMNMDNHIQQSNGQRSLERESTVDVPLFANNPFLNDNSSNNNYHHPYLYDPNLPDYYQYSTPMNMNNKQVVTEKSSHSVHESQNFRKSFTDDFHANPSVNYPLVGKKKASELNNEWSLERRSWTRLRVEKEERNVPNCRSGHACVQIGHYMYIIGGYSDGECFSDVYLLNLNSHQWRHIEDSGDIVSGRASHCCCVGIDNQDIYMFGGSGPSWGRTNLDDLCKFNTTRETWEVVQVTGQLPPPGYGQSLCRYKDKLLLFGGTCGSYFYNHLFEFNITTGTWTRLQATGRSPKPRYKHQAVVLGDSMYVLGGGQYTPDSGPMDIHRLDLLEMTWHLEDLGPSTPQARIAHTCVVDEANNQILIFGGRSASEAKLQDLYAWQIVPKGEHNQYGTSGLNFSGKVHNNGVDGCGITMHNDNDHDSSNGNANANTNANASSSIIGNSNTRTIDFMSNNNNNNNNGNTMIVTVDNDGTIVNDPERIYNFRNLPSSSQSFSSSSSSSSSSSNNMESASTYASSQSQNQNDLTNTTTTATTNVQIDSSLPGTVLSVTSSGILRDLFPESELNSTNKDPHQSRAPHGREFHCACFYDGQMFIFGGSTGVKRMNDTWRFKLDLTPPSLAILCAHTIKKHYDIDKLEENLKGILPDTLLESFKNLRPNVTDLQASLMN